MGRGKLESPFAERIRVVPRPGSIHSAIIVRAAAACVDDKCPDAASGATRIPMSLPSPIRNPFSICAIASSSSPARPAVSVGRCRSPARRSGATVVLHGRVVRKLEALYDEIKQAGHPEPVILPLDLAKASADDFANVANALHAQLRRLDALVHTAALLGSLGPLEHQSFDSWLALLRVNVAAPMGLTRALMRLLDAATDASVVFTLDDRGQAPRAYWGGYAVTKAGGHRARPRARRRVGAPAATARQCGGPRADPFAVARADASGRGCVAPALPESLVPLYLYLIAGQSKADSGVLIDAQAWLAKDIASTSLRL